MQIKVRHAILTLLSTKENKVLLEEAQALLVESLEIQARFPELASKQIKDESSVNDDGNAKEKGRKWDKWISKLLWKGEKEAAPVGNFGNPNCATKNCNAMALEIDEKKFDEVVKKASMRVVCVSTAMRSELRTLKKSVEALGYTLDVLGMNMKWQGLGSKVTLLTDYLQDVDDNDLILFVDAFDVLLMPDAKEIAKR